MSFPLLVAVLHGRFQVSVFHPYFIYIDQYLEIMPQVCNLSLKKVFRQISLQTFRACTFIFLGLWSVSLIFIHFFSVHPVRVGDVGVHDGGQLHPHPQPCLQSLGRLLHHVHRGEQPDDDDDDDLFVDDDDDDYSDLHSV